MCTSIVEVVATEGMAKRESAWFDLTQVVVAYDHARHAMLGDVITIDFCNPSLGAHARAGVEITLDSARALVATLQRAIAAADVEEAEHRGRPRPTAVDAILRLEPEPVRALQAAE